MYFFDDGFQVSEVLLQNRFFGIKLGYFLISDASLIEYSDDKESHTLLVRNICKKNVKNSSRKFFKDC